MEKRDVALGKAAVADAGLGTAAQPITTEERVAILESKVDLVLKMLTANDIHERKMEENLDLDDVQPADVNKDNIPIDINLIGASKGQVFVLTVRPEAYYIGNKPYKSLSAAATDVRGTRVSGWVFWKLPNGRTAKEAFCRS